MSRGRTAASVATMALSAPSARPNASRIVTHPSRGASAPSERARAVLAALADRPMPVLAHHLGRTVVAADPVEVIGLDDVWAALRSIGTTPTIAEPLAGGLIGALGYDFGRQIETLPAALPYPEGPPTVALGRFDTVAIEDADGHWQVASTGSASKAAELERIISSCGAPERSAIRSGPIHSSLPGATYRQAVELAREFIRAGDCYQVNLAARLSAEVEATDIELALRLWDAAGHARHAAFVGLPEGTLMSASPERLLCVEDGVALSEPIKGTAPLGAPPELLLSDKNRAEHVMIVDLMRNDLGRIARRGGVRVDELMVRRPTPYVDHLVSEVRAELNSSTTVDQILRAVFPGGSVTGAPKVRAMEIIRELEPVNRGPAYGSVVAIGTDGSLDASVSIRTAWLAQGRADYWAGGAIVWDSDADDEFAEKLLKARPFTSALVT